MTKVHTIDFVVQTGDSSATVTLNVNNDLCVYCMIPICPLLSRYRQLTGVDLI